MMRMSISLTSILACLSTAAWGGAGSGAGALSPFNACLSLGGQYRVFRLGETQSEIYTACQFKDGTLLDLYTIFQAQNHANFNQAATAFLKAQPAGVTQDAAVVCANAGATVTLAFPSSEPVALPPIPLCLFSDNSLISARMIDGGPTTYTMGAVLLKPMMMENDQNSETYPLAPNDQGKALFSQAVNTIKTPWPDAIFVHYEGRPSNDSSCKGLFNLSFNFINNAGEAANVFFTYHAGTQGAPCTLQQKIDLHTEPSLDYEYLGDLSEVKLSWNQVQNILKQHDASFVPVLFDVRRTLTAVPHSQPVVYEVFGSRQGEIITINATTGEIR